VDGAVRTAELAAGSSCPIGGSRRPRAARWRIEKAGFGQNAPVASDQVPEEGYSHVRVLCLDAEGCLLLMKWRDPVDGHETWEPPGGAVEAGESLLEAAERELVEETGISAKLHDRYVLVERDDTWKGVQRQRLEPCFFAAIGDAEVRPEMPTTEEADTLVEWRFVRHGDLDKLDAPVYPEDPFSLVGQLLA
jgi:8-oxo-dGTP pyrophosphatase MutT (NUDIX family)